VERSYVAGAIGKPQFIELALIDQYSKFLLYLLSDNGLREAPVA